MGFSRQERWVAISFSRGSSQSRNQTHISCTATWILYHWATWPFISWHFQELYLRQGPLPRTDHLCRWQPDTYLHVQNLNFWSTPLPCLTHIFPCRVSRQLHPSGVWGQNLWSPPWFLSFPHTPLWCPSEFYWVYLRSDPCDHFCPFKSGAGHWGSLVFLNTCAHVQTLLRGSRLTALWKLKTSITLTLHSLGPLLFI